MSFVDMIIKGTGNSRYMRSALSAGTTWEEALAMLRNGTFPFDFNGTNADGIKQFGTPINAKNLNDIVPSGTIAMWSGAVDDIPDGWALCNGQNGTPDLRSRFVIGAGSGYAVGATGGSTTHTHSFSVVAIRMGNTQTNNDSSNSTSMSSGNNLPPYYALCYIMKL